MIENSEDGEEIEIMCRDRLYNGFEVLDLIAYLNVTEWLNTPLMDNIINTLWEGPYETAAFWKNSTMHWVIENVTNLETDLPSMRKKTIKNPRVLTKKQVLGMWSLS